VAARGFDHDAENERVGFGEHDQSHGRPRRAAPTVRSIFRETDAVVVSGDAKCLFLGDLSCACEHVDALPDNSISPTLSPRFAKKRLTKTQTANTLDIDLLCDIRQLIKKIIKNVVMSCLPISPI